MWTKVLIVFAIIGLLPYVQLEEATTPVRLNVLHGFDKLGNRIFCKEGEYMDKTERKCIEGIPG